MKAKSESGSSGYSHSAYAASLEEFGTPRPLPRSGGWILERSIPGFPDHDAMGCYPLFACHDWSKLSADLDEIGKGLVSLVLVADPLGDYEPESLRQVFPDVFVPFKEHFVLDLSRDADATPSKHHLRNIRKARQVIAVDRCSDPGDLIDEWDQLYNVLRQRHALRGITAFSRHSFIKQLTVPGIVAYRGTVQGRAAGILLWYVQGSAAYYHLGAFSDEGYRAGASFALFSCALDEFRKEALRWVDLGAGAGVGAGSGGLGRFKSGWANTTRTAYLCGRIFDRQRYDEIVSAGGNATASYFPAYRAGEFG
jgi:GNAT acetyltransferase-like protein